MVNVKVPNEERNNYLHEKLMKIKSGLATANSVIQIIPIIDFQSEEEDVKKVATPLQAELEKAFKGE